MMNQEFLAAELESFRMRYPFDEDAALFASECLWKIPCEEDGFVRS